MKKPVIGITPSHNTDNDEISVRPTYLLSLIHIYATKLSGESASEAYFKEHYEVIIQDNALQNLARI